MNLVPKDINEAIKHLTPRSRKELKELERQDHPMDDLKSNFRSWEVENSTIEDVKELYQILRVRHPDYPAMYLKKLVKDWLGLNESINEAIKHLQPRSKEEIDKFLTETLRELHEASQDPNSSAETLKFFLEIIYTDRKQMIKDLLDEGLDPDDLLVQITDDLDNMPKSKHPTNQQREINYKLKVMSMMYNLIQKNRDKIDIDELSETDI